MGILCRSLSNVCLCLMLFTLGVGCGEPGDPQTIYGSAGNGGSECTRTVPGSVESTEDANSNGMLDPGEDENNNEMLDEVLATCAGKACPTNMGRRCMTKAGEAGAPATCVCDL